MRLQRQHCSQPWRAQRQQPQPPPAQHALQISQASTTVELFGGSLSRLHGGNVAHRSADVPGQVEGWRRKGEERNDQAQHEQHQLPDSVAARFAGSSAAEPRRRPLLGLVHRDGEVDWQEFVAGTMHDHEVYNEDNLAKVFKAFREKY